MKGKHHSKESKRKMSIAKIKHNISKDELEKLYLIQDLTQQQIGNYFRCSEATISRNLKKYNIQKI